MGTPSGQHSIQMAVHYDNFFLTPFFFILRNKSRVLTGSNIKGFCEVANEIPGPMSIQLWGSPSSPVHYGWVIIVIMRSSIPWGTSDRGSSLHIFVIYVFMCTYLPLFYILLERI